ncbi:MAG: hypothetical protein ACREKE_01305 [bacterium]
MALEKELETYNQKLSTLLKDEGKFVLIHEDEIGGTFVNYEDALKVGYEKYHLNPFLVKKIEQTATIFFFTRDMNSAILHPSTRT